MTKLKSEIRFVREMASALAGFEKPVLVVGVASVALAVLEGLSLSLLSPLIRAIQSASPSLRTLCVLMVGAVLLRAVVGFAHGVSVSALEARLSKKLRNALLRSFHHMPYVEFLSHDRGRLANLHTAQVESFLTTLSAGVSLFHGTLSIAAYGLVLLTLSWQVSVVALFVVALGALPLFWVNSRIRELAFRMVASEERLNGLLIDDLGGRHVIQALRLEDSRLGLHQEVQDRLCESAIRLQAWRLAFKSAVEGVGALVLLGGVFWVSALYPESYQRLLPIGMGFGFVLYRLQGRLHWIGESLSVLAQHRPQCESLLHFLGPTWAPRLRSKPGSVVHALQLREVSFSYGAGKGGVRGVSLALKRGDAVALVGRSGSGKTTLLNLLSGLLVPDSGVIEIEGSGEVGLVSEDAFIFNDTIFGNIDCGRGLSPTEVIEASRRAGLHEFVLSLPSAYETAVGFRGAALSAGQRQRLALARVLAGSPNVLLLDEATASLDAVTEKGVLDRLEERGAQAIRVVVTHRMPSARGFPRIFVMEGGRLVGEGTHDELLIKCREYRDLCAGWSRDSVSASRESALDVSGPNV